MGRAAGGPTRSDARHPLSHESLERLQVRVVGVVQGVGFRPFVHRLASSLELAGFVRNDDAGVTVEVEGEHGALLRFLERLDREKPAAALLYAVEHRFVAPQGETSFDIRPSDSSGEPRVWILPDLGTCDACRREIFDPEDRRYRYPFTNCTHCGPRFTILEGLPYDRPRTTMREFDMCPRCRAEYDDPADRRFHAQPNACAACGPRLSFHVAIGSSENPLRGSDDGNTAAGEAAPGDAEDALARAANWIRRGAILAVKGLGGYHIVVDAANEEAVARLRERKRRPFKPLAVMYPDLVRLRRHVEVPSFAEPLLCGSQSPIVLLPRTDAGWSEVAPSVAPGSPSLGVFLPYTPLHLLLLDELGIPVVATSGNRTDEPTLHRDDDAHSDLAGICDGFLVHDRPIARQADDSVLQVLLRPQPRFQMLRRARGYAPLPILSPRTLPRILALGGQMNSVFAVARDREVILSQHLGDLGNFASQQSFEQTLEDLLELYRIRPEVVAHDLHPDYFTTGLAERLGLPRMAVQHHHAHLAACMLENQIEAPVLGITWDGTGYGTDGTVWGGEFLLGGPEGYERVGSLVPFRLPGGDAAARDSWRVALSLLWETYGDDLPRDLPLFDRAQSGVDAGQVEMVLQMLRKDVRSPVCTSMGRLFDGVSALLGISYQNLHQAQSPQLLEAAAWRHGPVAAALPLPVHRSTEMLQLDWRDTVRALVEARRGGRACEELAAAFHLGLVEAADAVIRQLAPPQVALAGGVFCNRYLTEALLSRVEGRRVHVHGQLPPTDGSLAAGQLWVAAHRDS